MEHWDLIAKDLAGEISQEEKAQLNQWIAQSEDNQKEYKAAKEAWDMATPEATYSPNVEKAWEKVSEKTQTKIVSIKQPRKKLSLGLIAAVFVGIIGIGTILNYWLNKEDITLYATTNQVEDFTLPDGTKVWLNKNSQLSFTETFNQKERNVKLNGQGYFEVTSNKDKPFIITSKISKVEVLGTAFSIKAFDEDKTALLSVSEGKVAFSSDKDKQVFVAGEKGILYENKEISKYKIDPNDFAWQKGILTYQNVSLKQVFFDLEENYEIAIATSNSNILQCTFTGDLSTKNLDQNIEVLSLTIGLDFSKDGNQLTVSGKGCN